MPQQNTALHGRDAVLRESYYAPHTPASFTGDHFHLHRPAQDKPADLIFEHAKIITVDPQFSIVSSMAVRDGRIVAVGSEDQIRPLKGAGTTILDLGGKTVLPGLIDSHVHPAAAMTEFAHAVPEMESIDDVLSYISDRARTLGEGKWIEVQQVFITRLKEQRYPTRAELDQCAPKNPVVFSTGPDASLNTLALQLSGIDKNFKVKDDGPGYAEKDADNRRTHRHPSRLHALCENAYLPIASPTEHDRYQRTLRVVPAITTPSGLTSVADRAADPDAIVRYQKMRDAGELTVRLTISTHVDHDRLDGVDPKTHPPDRPKPAPQG